ncbi:MAG: hypothetical protein ILP18_08600, partial [Treponema sp.]|nr:hypothetical protein [Treponema sp.]
MLDRMDIFHEDRHKSAGLTVILAVVCALGIILPRKFGSYATVIMVGGIPFAYTDCFIFLAAGIGGLPAGILTFSIAFVSDALISVSFYPIYIMSTYLLIVLMSAVLSYSRCYARASRIPAAIVLLTLLIACLWEITTVHARMKNPYSGMIFPRLMLCAFPEAMVSVVIQWAYFRFAPDSLKDLLGSGWRYTEAYRRDRTIDNRRRSVLGFKMLFVSFATALATCAVVIVFATIYKRRGPPGKVPSAEFFNVENLRLLLVSASVAFPLSYLINIYSQHTVAHPLNRMSYLMERYFSDEGGHRFAQLPDLGIRSKDEISDLYTSLQKMLADMAGYMKTEEQKRQLEDDLRVEKAAGKAKSY